MVLISGIMAAGKSTVAQLAGRAPMTGELSDEAWRQLRLRHDLAAAAADGYAPAGFTVVLQDVVLGANCRRWSTGPCAARSRWWCSPPRADVVTARERDRPEHGYGDWPVDEIVTRAWAEGRIG